MVEGSPAGTLRGRILALDEEQFPQPGRRHDSTLAEARAFVGRQLSPEQRARLDALWQRTAQGIVADRAGGLPASAPLTSEVYPQDILRLVRLALDEHGLDWELSVAAHIRGSAGSALVEGLSARWHSVTELERTLLRTIAEFASLALQ
jgi:hypothetical protein